MDLVSSIYQLSTDWPREEMYGLTSQIRRAAVSVPANIAEGYGRESRASNQQFLRIAQGSLKEPETLLEIIVRVRIETEERTRSLLAACESVGKLLRLLIRKLEVGRKHG